MPSDHIHESHPEVVKRLKRAEGHLHRVIEMFGEGRSCLDLAQQLHAVEKAISEAKKTLIHDHVDHSISRRTVALPSRPRASWPSSRRFRDTCDGDSRPTV